MKGLIIAVQLTVLGSGSAGNATLLANGGNRLLVDAGLCCRELARRLERLGVPPDGLAGIVLTHAHGDHLRGAARFSDRFGTPVYATAATREAWGDGAVRVRAWGPLAPGRLLELAGFRFLPFVVPHDAVETLAFRIETPEGPIGFATDAGVVTAELIERFRDCLVLVMEANHAEELLRVSPYAAPVKARIGSREGHLSNEALAEFLGRHLGPAVRCVVLAHVSRVNNVYEIAELTCREALDRAGRRDVRIVVARQDRASAAVDLGEWTAPLAAPSRAVRQATLPFA